MQFGRMTLTAALLLAAAGAMASPVAQPVAGPGAAQPDAAQPGPDGQALPDRPGATDTQAPPPATVLLAQQQQPARLQPLAAAPPSNPARPSLDADTLATLDADTVRQAVGRSPLFLAELDYRGLTRANALSVTVATGAELALPDYLRATDLGTQPALEAVRVAPRAVGVIGPITQRSEVFLLQDRLIVSREVTVRVSIDACRAVPQTRDQQAFQASFCFNSIPVTQRGGQRGRLTTQPGTRQEISPVEGERTEPPTAEDVAAEARALRASLDGLAPTAIYAHGITVAAARRLSDEELIALELNGEDRQISHISVIPLQESLMAPQDFQREPRVAPPGALPQGLVMDLPAGQAVRDVPAALRVHVISRPDLRPVPALRGGSRLPPEALRAAETAGQQRALARQAYQAQQAAPGGLQLRREPPPVATLFQPRGASVSESADLYFLTGFTISRSIEDRYKVTFNKKRNYYVAFEYSVGFGMGLRFPFEVKASTTEWFSETAPDVWRSDRIDIDLSSRGVSGADRVAGVPSVYLASGLDPSLRFDDQEFVFRLWARCQLQVRVPIIKTVRVNCPGVNIPPEGTCPNWACARFTPPLLDGRQTLTRVTLPADVTRLRINAWIAEAGLEPGLRIEARDANLRFDLSTPNGWLDPSLLGPCVAAGRGTPGSRNRLLAQDRCEVHFFRAGHDSAGTMRIRAAALDGRDPSFVLADPVYRFTMALVPFIDAYARIDIWVADWELRRSFEIPGLTIQQDFRFDRHSGTLNARTLGLCSPADPASPACRNASLRIWQRDRADR